MSTIAQKPNLNSKRNVCVIVLGDIGRSPRMQYHVNSLLKHEFNVDLIGYGDTTPIAELTQNPRCNIQQLVAFPELNLPNLLKYLFKSMWQLLSLFIALFNIRRPDVILCQNPPGIPTLFVCYVYCMLFKRCKFIIDWHNYTYTILSLSDTSANDDATTTSISINPQRRIVKIAKWFESYFGRKSADNFCVTHAMQEDLQENWDIKWVFKIGLKSGPLQVESLSSTHRLHFFFFQSNGIVWSSTRSIPIDYVRRKAWFILSFGCWLLWVLATCPGWCWTPTNSIYIQRFWWNGAFTWKQTGYLDIKYQLDTRWRLFHSFESIGP